MGSQRAGHNKAPDHGDGFFCQDPTVYSGALYVNYTSIKLTKINVLNSPQTALIP